MLEKGHIFEGQGEVVGYETGSSPWEIQAGRVKFQKWDSLSFSTD